MSWLDKFKPGKQATQADLADFRRTLKYGDSYKEEWAELNQQIRNGESRRRDIIQKLGEATGYSKVEYPDYISVLDGIYVKHCKESPVGFCVVKGSVNQPFGEHRYCLFCKNKV